VNNLGLLGISSASLLGSEGLRNLEPGPDDGRKQYKRNQKPTVSRHPNGNAFLEAAILTTVPVDAEDAALLVFSAGAILDLLLNGAAKESLRERKQEKQTTN